MEDIVKRALMQTVTSLGQLTKDEQRALDRAVRRGELSKGKGGPYPVLKTVYAHPGFDFAADRQRFIDEMMEIARHDAKLREQRAWATGRKVGRV